MAGSRRTACTRSRRSWGGPCCWTSRPPSALTRARPATRSPPPSSRRRPTARGWRSVRATWCWCAPAGGRASTTEQRPTSAWIPGSPASARTVPGGWPGGRSWPRVRTPWPSSGLLRAPGTRCCPRTACCSSSTASTSWRRSTWRNWPRRGCRSSPSCCLRSTWSAPPARRSGRWQSWRMADESLAPQLAAFARRATFARLPDEVVDSVRKRVLDVLGICVAATPLDTSAAAREWVADQGGAAQSNAVGVGARMPATLAAFVNGVLAHSLDYDDTHLPSVLHPSASVVPAALAAGQYAAAGGSAAIAAIAAGLEVCVRLGMAGYDSAARNSVFFEHGQHATSICGAIGSAVAAGLLLDLDETRLTSAIGIAASMSSGVIEANRTGGSVKRMHCGWAAHAGISAAQLAARGFTGPETVLEGRFGFFQAWLRGEFDREAVTGG